MADTVLYAKFESSIPEEEYVLVGSVEQLQAAINDPEVKFVKLTADLTFGSTRGIASAIVISRSDLVLDGGDHKITFQKAGEVWNGDYIIQVYNAINVTIKNFTFEGGDAAILVNGSEVSVENITLINQIFGGIEVAKGTGITLSPELIINGITNDFETTEKPTVWLDQITAGFSHPNFFQYDKETQVYYYLKEENVPNPSLGIAVVTPSEFEAIQGTSDSYYLTNEIDFTGHTWTVDPKIFSGKLDGQGFAIKNLTIESAGQLGIFYEYQGEVVNLIIENADVTSTNDRVGIIAGKAGGTAKIANLTVLNSVVKGLKTNGVALLVGNTNKVNLLLENIIIRESTVINGVNNAGLLVGCAESTSNIIVRNVDLEGSVTATNRVGGIVGEMKGTSTLEVENAVIHVDTSAVGELIGGILGQLTASTSNIKNVFITINVLAYKDGSSTGAFIGKNSGTNVEVSSFAAISGLVTSHVGITDISETQTEAWWTTNLPDLLAIDWQYTNGRLELKR